MSSLDDDAIADLVEELDGGHAAVRRVPGEAARAFACKFEREVHTNIWEVAGILRLDASGCR